MAAGNCLAIAAAAAAQSPPPNPVVHARISGHLRPLNGTQELEVVEEGLRDRKTARWRPSHWFWQDHRWGHHFLADDVSGVQRRRLHREQGRLGCPQLEVAQEQAVELS